MLSEPSSQLSEVRRKRRGGPRPGTPAQARSLANLRPFKPGQSGNPLGKPKKTMTEALIRKLVTKRVNALAEALIREAESGNVLAWKEACDRTEGKVADRIEVSGNVDLGLRIAAARARCRSLSEASVDTAAGQVTVENQPALASDSPNGRVDDSVDVADIFGPH